MTTFSTSLPNHMVLLPQSHDSSHHVLVAKCPPQPTHLPLLHSVNSTDHLGPRKWPGGIPLLFSLWKDQQEYWHLHHSHCRNTLFYVHITLCTLPNYDMSLGWLTVGVPEARDFVGSLVLDVCMYACMHICMCVCARVWPSYQFHLQKLTMHINSVWYTIRQKGTDTYNSTSTAKCT